MKKSIEHGGARVLASYTDSAMDGYFRVVVMNLKRLGHRQTAYQLQSEWAQHKGKLTQIVDYGDRYIGQYDPISEFLARWYDKLEALLTLEVARALRISDIKTFNYCIRVVILSPCTYGVHDFYEHFVHDAKYRGLFPVLVYHTSNLSCSLASFGTLVYWACGPLSSLIEMGADRWLGPKIAGPLYDAFCN